jgi:hypothetical protein
MLPSLPAGLLVSSAPATHGTSTHLRVGGMNGARQSISGSLKNAGFRSLGSLAQNAFFSDTIEGLIWPLSALDRSGSSTGETK